VFPVRFRPEREGREASARDFREEEMKEIPEVEMLQNAMSIVFRKGVGVGRIEKSCERHGWGGRGGEGG